MGEREKDRQKQREKGNRGRWKRETDGDRKKEKQREAKAFCPPARELDHTPTKTKPFQIFPLISESFHQL